MQNRVFFPQLALDHWITEGTIDLQGTELSITKEARRYRLAEAAHILKEVTGAPDVNELVGRVKSKQYLQELGAELLEDSLILGDNAYEVIPGFLGVPHRDVRGVRLVAGAEGPREPVPPGRTAHRGGFSSSAS